MKFSENWLREWVNPAITTEELVVRLTMAGLEVDAVESVGETLVGVVVGEIVSVEPHPDAEKLQICQVAGHPEGAVQVVCGAANARVGIKVPFATIGAKLPGDFSIKKAKLRGVESFGMLCAQTELHLGDDDNGLWELPADAPVGEEFHKWLQLNDSLIDVDLTPNRSDCLSIRGLAREVGALTETKVNEPTFDAVVPIVSDTLAVDVTAKEACPVYIGRVIKNVNIRRPSPIWLTEKLRRCGIRSIDPVVDVTNFVLLELGQPMHAFDLQKLQGGIVVRYAQENEAIALLNGQSMALRSDTLVIADHSNPLAIAGVMGGADSAVSEQTENVFLESAFFAPRHIAGVARSYGLHTDSSHRFERGVDYQLQTQAIERATALLLQIVGGEPGPLVSQVSDRTLPGQGEVTLTRRRLEKGLTLDLRDMDIPGLMQRLGLELTSGNDQKWVFKIPSYRYDIEIEEDLLEEVARIYGYDKLPTRALSFATDLESHSEVDTPIGALKNILCARGYQEIITYSFVDPKLHEQIFGQAPVVALKNPISADMASMRTSLLPGLLATLIYNLNRQQTSAKLFEAGMVFQPISDKISELKQENHLAGLIYGPWRSASWSEKSRETDFFDIKGDLEALLTITARGHAIEFLPLRDADYLHPGQSASITIDGVALGYVGALHPNKLKLLGLARTVWLFECSLPPMIAAALPRFTSLSRYPEVSRDLAVVVDSAVCVSVIDTSIRNVAGHVLKELKLFDVYSGEGIDPKGKSLAFSLTFQDLERTLTDDEVNASMAGIIAHLEQEHGATLR